MNGSERWVAVSALGAAMFAIGFSFTAVACSTHDMTVSEAARSVDSAGTSVSVSAVPAPASSLSNVAKIVNAAPSVVAAVPVVTAAASALSASSAAGAELKTASAGLKVKRFVVTHKIENREPVAGDDFTLGGAPVYAFVELENSASDARNIRVMFQNEDTKATVGHVKLTVPAGQTRYRTWGNTRLIRDPGHWVAVVSTVDGVELGRAPFEVKG